MKKHAESSLFNPQNLATVGRRAIKRIYHQFLLNGQQQKRLVFVVGCQRSGTTMLMSTFERDFQTKLYGETGLSPKNSRRLKPYPEIAQIVARDKAPLIITKPLVESQNILKLLAYFPGSKAIWMYRGYKDVANSIIHRFSINTTMRNLRSIIGGEGGDAWFSEAVSEETRQVVAHFFAEDMTPGEANTLLWYVRNILFFELKLDHHPDVFLCKYEDIVAQPGQMMRNIYQFLGFNYPGDRIVSHIHTQSVSRGKSIDISPELEALCAALLQKIEEVYTARLAPAAPKMSQPPNLLEKTQALS